MIIERSDAGSVLVLDGPWSDEARDLVLTGVVDGLVLNYAKGFFAQDLEFLRGLPLRSVTLLARWFEDLSPIESLGSTLVELHLIAAPKATVDLASLPRLRVLSSEWKHVARTWHAHPETLERIVLGNCAAPNLGRLGLSPALTWFTLTGRPALESFESIEATPWLRVLEVAYAPRLTDLSALASTALLGLEELSLESCKRFTSLEHLQGLRGLRDLNVANCGELESALPLAGLDSLERIWAGESTKFVDGDLTPIANLPRLRDLRLVNRRHYRPTTDDIKAAIAERNAAEGDQPK